jgi:predicted RNase H-like HicB family nuclease
LENIKEAIALYLEAGIDETLRFEGEVHQVAI